MDKLLHSKIIGNGKPLLILHGLFGMSDNWMTLGRHFAEYFEVHLIDLRNHGRSFHDDCMNYEVMSRDIWEYCHHYHLNSVYVLGHSMGGKTAMFWAVQHPEMVEKLIVADIAPKKYSNRHQLIFKALNSIDFEVLKTRKEVERKLSETISDLGILQFLLKNVYHQTTEKLAFRFNREVLEKNYALLNETLPPFATFDKETLFLKGEKSDYIRDEDQSLIQAHFPQSNIATISNAGHWLHAENPNVFYENCMLFLKS